MGRSGVRLQGMVVGSWEQNGEGGEGAIKPNCGRVDCDSLLHRSPPNQLHLPQQYLYLPQQYLYLPE